MINAYRVYECFFSLRNHEGGRGRELGSVEEEAFNMKPPVFLMRFKTAADVRKSHTCQRIQGTVFGILGLRKVFHSHAGQVLRNFTRREDLLYQVDF